MFASKQSYQIPLVRLNCSFCSWYSQFRNGFPTTLLKKICLFFPPATLCLLIKINQTLTLQPFGNAKCVSEGVCWRHHSNSTAKAPKTIAAAQWLEKNCLFHGWDEKPVLILYSNKVLCRAHGMAPLLWIIMRTEWDAGNVDARSLFVYKHQWNGIDKGLAKVSILHLIRGCANTQNISFSPI